MSLFRKRSVDSNASHCLFTFVPERISQNALKNLSVKADLYNKTLRDYAHMELTDRRIYQYEPSSLNVEIVPGPDNPNELKIVYGRKLLGYVPRKHVKHVLFALEKNCEITAELSGGPYKIIKVWHDDYGHPSYSNDKHKDDIELKIRIEYK